MARLISELGADVIDDTVVEKKHKISPKKRNYIIGLSALGVGIIGLGVVYYAAINFWLSDYQNMPYISYNINTQPDTDGEFKGEITASIAVVHNNKNYPSVFKVPERINGYRITRIEDNAFAACDRLTRVEMPNSIVSIGRQAFINCSKLKTFKFSKRLTQIGTDAFVGTAYKASWVEHETVSINNTLLYVNESKLLSDYGKSKIAFVKDDNSSYISQYSDDLVFSLKSLAVAGSNSSSTNITSWMNGIFAGFKHVEFFESPDYLDLIPQDSFKNCTSLKKVVLSPETIGVGGSAFERCTSLTDIEINNNLSILESYCFKDTKISINSLHEGVDVMEEGVFQNCKNITNFTIPASLTYISDYAFDNTNMSSITFTDADEIVGIGDGAFRNTQFTSFDFPKNIDVISDLVLANCDNLTAVTSYETVNRIDGFAFRNSEKLVSFKTRNADGTIASRCSDDETIYLPAKLSTTVASSSSLSGGYNFAGTATKKVVVPYENLKDLAAHMFEDCEDLESVTFDNANRSVMKRIMDYCFAGCEKLPSIHLPNFISQIATHVFDGCTALTTIHLPEVKERSSYQTRMASASEYTSVYSTIKEYLFSNCVNLSNIEFPSTLTTICAGSFNNCTSIENLFIPETINTIYGHAFDGCGDLYLSIGSGSVPVKWFNNWDAGVKGYVLGSLSVYDEDGFTVSLNTDNKTLTIVDILDKDATSVTIPETIGGKKVVAINDNFLYGNSKVTSVVLPDTINNIGDGAFQNMENLTGITLENGFAYLGNTSNKYVGLIGIANDYLGEDEQYEGDYVLNSNVKAIEERVITADVPTNTDDAGNEYLPTSDNEYFALVAGINVKDAVVINENTKMIGSFAFEKYNRLSTVIIPAGVERVAKSAFTGSPNAKIYSATSASLEGWNYSWNTSNVDHYWETLGPLSLAGGDFTGCENLDHSARITGYVGGLSRVDITPTIKDRSGNEYNVTRISEGFLENDEDVTFLYIPSSVTKVEANAISGCPALKIYCEAVSEPTTWEAGWNTDNNPTYYGAIDNVTYALIDDVYYMIEGGNATVTNYARGLTDVNIQSTVKIGETNYNVTKIAESAFAEANTIVRVFIPSSVTFVDKNAFLACDRATIYVEGASTSSWDENWNVSSRPVYTSKSVNDVKTIDGVDYIVEGGSASAVAASYGVETINIPDKVAFGNSEYNVTKVGEKAFTNHDRIVGAKFGANVTRIENQAFYGCESLKYASVSENVTYIGAYAFGETNGSFTLFISPDHVGEEWNESWIYLNAAEEDEISYVLEEGVNWEYGEDGIPALISQDEDEDDE